MNLPKYPVVASDPFIYHFYSEGPQGRIKKAVIYAPIEDDVFNLAFGDWDGRLHRINDSNRSNNRDRDKVLATNKGLKRAMLSEPSLLQLVDICVCYYAVVAYCMGDDRVKGIPGGAGQSGLELKD